jgi:hypothetical protein
MPRIARVAAGDVVQHALNRGNGRVRLFRKPGDYAAFVDLLGAALDRTPGVRLLGGASCPTTGTGCCGRPRTASGRRSCGGWPTRTCGGGGNTTTRSARGTCTRDGSFPVQDDRT